MRRKTKTIWIGDIPIGSNHPIVIQSMTNTDTRDFNNTINQIKYLAELGCQIIRLAVVDNESIEILKKIKKESPIPIIADIHFDYKLAIDSLKIGVDGLRINPGNIGSKENIKKIIKEASKRDITIRIGINSGSLEKSLFKKYGKITAEAMVESALNHINLFEKFNYYKMKISMKSSNLPIMLKAYKLLANKNEYPFHIGVTEAGTLKNGIIKSTLGIGILLNKGLGDTIRVSLTADPSEEIYTAIKILKNLGIRKNGIELISCPTCGRTEINLISLAKKVEEYTKNIDLPIKIAVMGCPVNGPGEAKDADIGIAGGLKQGLIFKKGKIIAKIKEKDLFFRFKKELDLLVKEIKRRII